MKMLYLYTLSVLLFLLLYLMGRLGLPLVIRVLGRGWRHLSSELNDIRSNWMCTLRNSILPTVPGEKTPTITSAVTILLSFASSPKLIFLIIFYLVMVYSAFWADLSLGHNGFFDLMKDGFLVYPLHFTVQLFPLSLPILLLLLMILCLPKMRDRNRVSKWRDLLVASPFIFAYAIFLSVIYGFSGRLILH